MNKENYDLKKEYVEDVIVKRINSYDDERFSEKILLQHGAFVVNENFLYEVEIINEDSAIIHGENMNYYKEVIEEFRFYSEHIIKFYDMNRNLIKEYDEINTFYVNIKDIQPSQFYVDKTKKEAVSSFINNEEDIVIPLIKYEDRYVSLDGHTRISVGINKGFEKVKGFLSEENSYIYDFVKEAELRSITSPYKMIEVSHEDYKIKWNKFCEEYFLNK